MAVEIVPLSCALRFKPPTLVLLYKDLQTGKNRRRSMPLRELTAETSLPSYTTQLLSSSRHAAYVARIPPDQLASLLQRVRDAQIQVKPGLHTTTTIASRTPLLRGTSSHTSPLHTSLVDAPSLTLNTKLPCEGGEGGGGGGSVLNEQFESALAELLGDGSNADDSGGPSADGIVQSSSVGDTNVHSDSEGKRLEQLKIPVAGDQSKHPIHDPPKSSPDFTGLPTATTSLYGRKLPPLGPTGAGHAGQGKLTTSGEAVGKERNGAGAGPGDGVLSSVVLTRLSSERRGGVETTSSSRGKESLQQSKRRQPPPGTFPTEVPDYSADFSSDSEAPSSHRPAVGGEQSSGQQAPGGGKSPWQQAGGGGKSPLAEDASLSFEIDHHPSTSCSSLHAGDLSADPDFDLSSDGSLGGRNFSASAIITGDNSHASGGEEDLNKASDEHLGTRKAQMDVLFEANRLHPGDKGYVYDKEVEFAHPQIESGWDSDDSCSDF